MVTTKGMSWAASPATDAYQNLERHLEQDTWADRASISPDQDAASVASKSDEFSD
jgi:hypothetical protein